MPFTAIPGSAGAMPGLISPGIATTFVSGPFGFSVDAISATEILVRYSVPVNLNDPSTDANSALLLANYSINVDSNPAQTLVGVKESGAHPYSVILTVSGYLKYGSTYSISIVGVRSLDNTRGVTSNGVNFTAKTKAPPIPLGAFFSLENHIDVVFDRDLKSGISPTASINSTSLTFVSCVENRLRYTLPPMLPTTGGWTVDLGETEDIWGNKYDSANSDSIPINVVAHDSFDYSNYASIQVLDSFLVNTSPVTGSTTPVKTLRVLLSNALTSTTISAGSIGGGLSVVSKNGVATNFSIQTSSGVPLTSPDCYILDVYVTGDLDGTTVSITTSPAINPFTPRDISEPAVSSGSASSPSDYLQANFSHPVLNSANQIFLDGLEINGLATRVKTSQPVLVLAIVDLWHAFYKHTNNSHNATQSFTLSSTNLPQSPSLSDVSTSFISLKNLICAHFQQAFHKFQDPYIGELNSRLLEVNADSIISWDFLSSYFATLVAFFDQHTLNGPIHASGSSEQGFSQRTYCGVYANSIEFATPNGQKINARYEIRSAISSYYYDSSQNPQVVSSLDSTEVIGLDAYPQVSAAYPASGVELLYGKPRVWKDRVEVWYSKPMASVGIDDLTITGGLTITDKSWVTDRMAKCDVSGMAEVSYTASSTGSIDLAGNEVQS